MLASPLVLLLRGWRGPQWLKKNRRYFGVAAFGYAAIHTILYLVDQNSVTRVLADLPKLYIWTGGIAFVIFIPLAATSMDYFVRRMGPNWKRLQRWTYGAAVLTLIHWAALHDWGGLAQPWCILAHLGCWKDIAYGTGTCAPTATHGLRVIANIRRPRSIRQSGLY